ncbi:MAG: hypothetical protein ACRDY3_01550, partial [Acidimicrobiales bacterium]
MGPEAARWRSAGAVAGVVAILATVAPAAGAATGAGSGTAAVAVTAPPAAPARAVALAEPGTVEIAWSPSPASPEAPLAGYRVAPVTGGVPCPACQGAVSVGPATTSVVLASPAGSGTYAVQASGPGGTSAWVAAQTPAA